MAPINQIPETRHGSTGKTWSAALVLTLIMHTVVIGALLILRPFTPAPVQATPSDPIELVFVSDPEPESEDPNFFSELPEELEDEAPDDPDFLSNIDSRARDRVARESDSSLPRLEGSSEAPHIAFTPGDPAPTSPSLAEQNPPQPEPETNTLGSQITRSQEPQPPARDPRLLLARPDGMMDFFQEAMVNPEGGLPLFGGVSLNTVAWAYAPWLQKFRRDFLRDWTAPPAWHLGLIDGSHVLELEILPSGELVRLVVKSQEGSPVLVETSSRTFEILAPFRPLPEDFPEERLILGIKLVYPQLVQQPSPRPRPPEGRRTKRGRQRGS